MYQNKAKLTKSELAVYNQIYNNPHLIEKSSILDLEKHIQVSKSAILRLCKKIGYSGYSEFRFDVIRYGHSKAVLNSQLEGQRLLVSISNLYSSAISNISAAVSEEDILKLAGLIKKAGRIFAVGFGKSGLLAQKLKFNFIRLSSYIDAIDDIVVVNDMEKIVRKNHLVIFFSESGNTPDILSGMQKLKGKGAGVALITNNSRASAREFADPVICLPSISAVKETLLDSQVIAYAFIEILTAYYVK